MKIIVAGYGVEGRQNLQYFRQRYPQAEIMIADQHPVLDVPDDVVVLSGDDVFATQLYDADLVVRTASLPPGDIQTAGKIWSATNEFFAMCPVPIIGVTGTKGKGTTCSFIASILRAAGKTVHLVGNIGTPALSVLPKIRPDDVVVYELSSFQLWDIQRSPHVAVVLMVEPDHLDKHRDFTDYLEAKANIVRYQQANDVVVYDQHNQYSREIATRSLARQVAYLGNVSDDILDAVILPGRHNRDNASAAVIAARSINPALSDEVLRQGLAEFTGLPHRLKFVAEKNLVRYYDDSISTTPGSAIAAMQAFEQPKVLLVGGSDKGADYTELAQELARSSSLRKVIVTGDNAKVILSALRQAKVPEELVVHEEAVHMTDLVHVAMMVAQPGDVVILSPTAASFDHYNNYVDRGERYVSAVLAIEEK